MGARERLRLLRRKALYGWKATSESYVAHLRSVGIEVGDGCEVFSPEVTHVDTTAPHLLTIGSRVAMTGPVTILCHDYSVGVTKVWSHGDVLGSQRRTRVGDNVFLAYGCIVLAGTEIGDDVVIGAGALATGKLRGGVVYGGVPAMPICTVEEFYRKRKERQLAEAVDQWHAYVGRFGREPAPEVFHEYFYLFTRGAEGLPTAFRRKLDDRGNAAECLAYLRDGRNDAPFASFNEFAGYARKH